MHFVPRYDDYYRVKINVLIEVFWSLLLTQTDKHPSEAETKNISRSLIPLDAIQFWFLST